MDAGYPDFIEKSELEDETYLKDEFITIRAKIKVNP
jgi:hypothetical protein